MPSFSPSELQRVVRERLPRGASGALCVAFSGGLDSTVLLHAAARMCREHGGRVRAVHVDHGLHADSARWEEHCRSSAAQLAVEYASIRVSVQAADEGVEAGARQARYDALRAVLAPGETLLTAHHADDQLETVLLALMRGAGARGLSAMAPLRGFGAGWHMRPLLQFTRDELLSWARAERLSWLEDPANASLRFDRNYLRSAIVPALRQRWPAAALSAARSAGHLGEAVTLLDQVAAADLSVAAVGRGVCVERLWQLDPSRRRNALRYWVRTCGARAPSTRKLAALELDVSVAREDRVPCIAWDDFAVRRYRGVLYCDRWHTAPPSATSLAWNASQPLALPGNLGHLRAQIESSGGLAAAACERGLRVGFRAGSATIRPIGDTHHRSLKKLFQSAGILPWWRAHIPLLFVGADLAAVGDLWVAAEFAARAGEPGVRIVWEGRPRIEAERAE
jgi:tRNA(Ile)-lysidine synthase